jgi:BMFP domain-containing protein YqiC
MQSSNRLLDDLAKMANGALSAAAGARQELDQFMQQRIERFMNKKGWVSREEFDAVRDMARKSREEQETLAARLSELEALMAKPRTPTRKPAAVAERRKTLSPHKPTSDTKP